MAFDKNSYFREIQGVLEERGGYCPEIANFLGDWSEMTIQTVIDKFSTKTEDVSDIVVVGRVIVAIDVIGELFTEDENDVLLRLLIDKKIRNMQMLFLWRKIKNRHNISKETKEYIISKIKGTLPKAEKEGDWDYE